MSWATFGKCRVCHGNAAASREEISVLCCAHWVYLQLPGRAVSVGLCCAPKQKPWRSAQGHRRQSIRAGRKGTTGFHGQRRGPGCTHMGCWEGSHGTLQAVPLLSQPGGLRSAPCAQLRPGLGSGSQNAGVAPWPQSSVGPQGTGNGGGGAAAVGEAESPRGPPAAFPELRCARTRLASFFPPPPRSLAAFAMIHICSRQQTVT